MKMRWFGLVSVGLVLTAKSVGAQGMDEIPSYVEPPADGGAPADAGPPNSAANPSLNASASSVENPADGRPISSASEGGSHTGTRANVTLGGYAEVFWQYNFNRPVNGVTAFRAFDVVHNAFTVSNLVLDAQWNWQRVSGRIALQVGHTANLMYASEPNPIGLRGVVPTGPDVWKWIQQAWIAYNAPVGRGLLFEAGIFLSPIGPEGMAVKDQWNWSRSNLFAALPYYHTGARATYSLTPTMALSVGGYNGWNSVVDNNPEKSLSVQWTYNRPEKITASVLYFSGVERPFGSVGGRGWRHTFVAYVLAQPTRWLSCIAHANGGFESLTEGEAMGASRYNGTQWWAGGALYARVKASSWLYLAVRGDLLAEVISQQPRGQQAAPNIFFPSSPVGSFTGTVDFRPHENLSFRVEYRHDASANPQYFGDQNVGRDPTNPQPNFVDYQNTLTFGATAWY